MSRAWPILLSIALSVPCLSPALRAQDEAKSEAGKAEADATALTLENLFPKRGLFGPAAQNAAFSSSGRNAAWLYKPYAERRHGNDLWVYDVGSGTVTRVTSAPVMAEFQAEAREVVTARKKKWSKLADGKTDNDGGFVGDDDAEAEKEPRYAGIGGFVWAPKKDGTGKDGTEKDEMLFWSGGDVYRFVLGGAIERLTRTDDAESSVDYLPDGSGYTYLRDDRLYCVRFGSHLLEQLDPEFESGDTLTGYEISPDGKRAVFVTRKGDSPREGDRKVKIARYTERFMEVREVPRQVSDDPIKPSQMRVWLYELGGTMAENGPIYRIFSQDVSGPRDVLRTPEWSPDSSRVVFAAFAQKSSNVEVLEALFPKEPPKPSADKAADEPAKPGDGATDGDGDGDRERDERGERRRGSRKPQRIHDVPARVVHRFLHDGGPNTPRMIAPKYLADSHHVVFLSEQSGFRHLHVLDPLYSSLRQLTSGNWEVYPIDLSNDRTAVWAIATKEHPARRDAYRIDVESGAMTKLTPEVGSYDDAVVSPDGAHVLATFTSWGHPRELVHVKTGKNTQRALTDSHPATARAFTKVEPELFSYRNRHGHTIHGHVIKPDGWKKTDKRPLLLYVYGGPLGTSKQVTYGNFHGDSYFFALYMARTHGWVACTIDPRGMSGYGALFEKSNFEQVGKPQTEDLVDGVAHLVAEHGVDSKRVGIHGWSFGGFQTQMCMYTEPKVFQVGIAGAGPTEWENYNSWYSTGTIGESREGKTDLGKYSLLPLAKNLEGRLLLVHGMEDSNVLYQDTVRVYRELLKAGKETLVDLFLDPTGGHGLGGDVQRLGKARKYEEFLVRHLGSVETAGPDLLTGGAGGEPAAATSSPGKQDDR